MFWVSLTHWAGCKSHVTIVLLFRGMSYDSVAWFIAKQISWILLLS